MGARTEPTSHFSLIHVLRGCIIITKAICLVKPETQHKTIFYGEGQDSVGNGKIIYAVGQGGQNDARQGKILWVKVIL